MNKVEEKALERYPRQLRTTVYGGTTCIDDDIYKAKREAFVEGYREAVNDITDILLKKLSKKNSLEATTICRTIKLYLR